ncbi:hypothetical protein [Cryptosporangium arvum]|uniref:hypothetical protein n=1 Tax=Cryptosporangium arvum TaxID=80871 RepID=UPI0004AFE1D9|nr:hypothetical protein [Cryptosporangium arvum]
MTTYSPTAPARKRPGSGAGGKRGLRPWTLAVGAIIALQGVVIGALALSGYFYLDDLDMSAEAAKHPFGWDYVTLALNDHLTPGLRTFYWLSAHLAPYDNTTTVVVRLLAQAVATGLMAYLLAQLLGPGKAALLGLGLYAFSPLLVPSLLSLSSGVNLLPTHIGILLLLVMHVRYEATRELRYAVFGALGVLLALVFWEKAVLSVGLAPLLTLLYLSSGGVKARFRAVGRSWAAWVAYATPVVVFFAFFVLGDYAKSGSSPKVGDIWNVFWDAWMHSLAPSLFGGPWNWYSAEIIYYSAAHPGPITTVAGQLTAIVLSAVAVRRNGYRALRAWLLPFTVLLGTAVLLAAGRFEYVGVILARNFHYLSELTIPLVLAAVLLLVVPDPAAVAERGRSGLFPGDEEPATRTVSLGLVAVLLVYAVSYGVTVRGFEDRWVENPIRDYLTTGIHDLRTNAADRQIAIYDNTAPPAVATLLQVNRRVSDIFRPIERGLPNAVRWDDASRPLYMFDQGGHLLRARLVEEATSADQPGVFCAHPLRGVGSVTVTLSKRITRPDSFVRLDYLSRLPSTVSIRLADGDRTFAPRRFATPTLTAGKYSSVLLGTPGKAYDRVTVSTTDPDASICLAAKAGHPEPMS